MDICRTPAYQGPMIDLNEWDYLLPPERIASRPAPERDGSRLLVLPLAGGPPSHAAFRDLPSLLQPGDLLVVNDTRVMAARLYARRASGGRVELLVVDDPSMPEVRTLARPARKLAPGDVLALEGGGSVAVLHRDGSEATVRFDRPALQVMADQGAIPLPPYMGREADASDSERYQTIYAGEHGAVAAPTAGLHFSSRIFSALADRGVGTASVTLHVGIGTFRPLRVEDVERGRLHVERYHVPEATAARIAATKREGGRVIAVGTTSARTLEAATPAGARTPEPGPGQTDLFIQPPYTFKVVQGLITNFHLPRSSLLMLVASLVSRERLLSAYDEAIAREYSFYSYGDAMLLL